MNLISYYVIFLCFIKNGVTNLWIGLEPAKVIWNQSDPPISNPEPPRATKNRPESVISESKFSYFLKLSFVT